MESYLYLPKDLSLYKIILNHNKCQNILICEISYNDYTFCSEISESDLESGLIDLSKLANIINLNSKQTQPNFNIWLDIYLSNTNEIYLVLNINFSNVFIDFEEKFYFKQKNIISSKITNTNIELEKIVEKNIELEKIVESQAQEILQLSNTIGNMGLIIEAIGNKFDKIIDIININFNKIESEKCYSLKTYVNNIDFVHCMIPKKINKMELTCNYLDDKFNDCKYKHFTASFNYDFMLKDEIFNYIIKDEEINKWAKYILSFDIDIIKTDIYYSGYLGYNCYDENWFMRTTYSDVIFNTYLGGKKDFRVKEIIIDDIKLLKTLMKYTNYDKLTINCIDKFDNVLIKSYCETNNIQLQFIK